MPVEVHRFPAQASEDLECTVSVEEEKIFLKLFPPLPFYQTLIFLLKKILFLISI